MAVPAFFIEDHWWPHSSIRERAATLREPDSTSELDETVGGMGDAGAVWALPEEEGAEAGAAQADDPALLRQATTTITCVKPPPTR